MAFSLIRQPDDPIALRASIGGTPEIGWYLSYRGDPLKVLAMLREVMVEAEERLPREGGNMTVPDGSNRT